MRVSAAKDFMDDSEIKVILVSLKAGNAGLNLNAASQVIIMDPHWNPSLELQAIDRAHRIGQQKPVQVHRILVKETVEDRIMQLQEDKRQVVEGALDDTSRKLRVVPIMLSWILILWLSVSSWTTSLSSSIDRDTQLGR